MLLTEIKYGISELSEKLDEMIAKTRENFEHQNISLTSPLHTDRYDAFLRDGFSCGAWLLASELRHLTLLQFFTLCG